MMEVDTDVNENQDKMKHVTKKKKVSVRLTPQLSWIQSLC